MEVVQKVLGNTGQRSVSHSSSPASASVRQQSANTVIGQPGISGGGGSSNLGVGGGVQGQVGQMPGGGMPVPGQSPVGQQPGQQPGTPGTNPDMNLIMGLTDQLRSGALDTTGFATQLKSYLGEFSNRLRTDLSSAVSARRDQARQQAEQARQRATQTASQALTTAQQQARAAQGGAGNATGGTSPAQLNGISSAEQWIIDRESSGNPNAYNPTPTDTGNAFGLGQLTTLNRQRYGAQLGINPDTTDPNEQLQLMRAYITDRYGSAEAAQAFWQQNGWY